MAVYLGPVGNLIAVPDFGDKLTTDLDLQTAVHQIAGPSGGRVVDRVGAVKRTYHLSCAGMTPDELTIYEGLALGAYGPGPFVLLEPWRRNMLSANQSTGTDVLRDTTGFVAITGAISSSTAQAHTGLRSLAWAVTAANQRMMQGSLANTTNATLGSDTPVLPSTAYTGQVRARLSASTGTVRLDVYWFTAAGAFISASTGTAVAQSTAFGSPLTVIATSPSTAALARLSVTNTVMGAAQTIYLDQWQIESGSVANAWTVGTGVPRVSFTEDVAQSYGIFPSVNANLTLVEV